MSDRRENHLRILPVLFLLFILVFSSLSVNAALDPMSPQYVNEIISVVSTPSVLPDGFGTLVINMTNPYDNVSMENVSFVIGIYAFSTLDRYVPLGEMEQPPVLRNGSEEGAQIALHWDSIEPGRNHTLHIDIEMQRGSLTGSVFNQGSYFLRMSMNFTLGNETYLLLSRGFMSDEAKSFLDGYHGFINSTQLQSFGFDAILPDTSFAVRVPIPKWPFYALVGLAALTCVAIVFSYVEDNPGAFPSIERQYLWLKGKYRWMRSRRRE